MVHKKERGLILSESLHSDSFAFEIGFENVGQGDELQKRSEKNTRASGLNVARSLNSHNLVIALLYYLYLHMSVFPSECHCKHFITFCRRNQ